MAPIAAAGFTAAAIDVRGYGGSGKPHAVEAYDMASIIGDLQAVADALGGGTAILIGHDWGAPIVWTRASRRTGATSALSPVCPCRYIGPWLAPFIDILTQMFTDKAGSSTWPISRTRASPKPKPRPMCGRFLRTHLLQLVGRRARGRLAAGKKPARRCWRA